MTINSTEATIAGVTPFVLTLLAGKPYISFLQKKYMGQYIREDGPQSHQSKAGTPTAGGVMIVLSFLLAIVGLTVAKSTTFLSLPVLLVIGVTLVFSLLGFGDDYLKISKKKNKGVSGYTKLLVQIAAGLGVGYALMQVNPQASTVSFFGLGSIQLGWLFPVFAALVVTAASNAVNLTDGLDGLASGTALLAFMTMALMFQVAGQIDLALVCRAMAGACLGFLVFNHYPARIFMGGTGSLALGGALGALAVVGKIEFWLIPVGAVFVAEALSVILQVISFKTTGKRIFRMSPLHHYFELGGWKETKVVFAFITAQFLFCMAALIFYGPTP